MKCPTCKGFCCGSLYHDEWGAPPLRFRHVSSRISPWSVLPATHTCPDCDDGTYEVCSDPEPFVRERTAEDERADVLAFLRETLAASETAHASDDLDYAIDIIASGGHVGAAKREKT